MPAYEIEKPTGKGPQLFSVDGDFVSPDLLAFNANGITWIEAKHKTCFTWYRNGGYWTTGIDLRHYEDYKRVADRTSLPVWLMFWHPRSTPDDRDLAYNCPPECPTGLFGNDIRVLAETESHQSPNWGRSGMVYWSPKSLRLLAPRDAVEAAAASLKLRKEAA